MKDYIKDRKVFISISDISFSPNLRKKNFNDLFHKDNWELPKEGELVIIEYENKYKELIRMNSNIDTDEIISWCYLNDIL